MDQSSLSHTEPGDADGNRAPTGSEYDASYYRTRLGSPYNWDNPVWIEFFGSVADYIVATLAPQTALDVGCGIGFLVGALRHRGVDARGIDVSEYAISQVPEKLRPYCTKRSVTDEIDGRFDLVTCIEVLEHLQPDEADAAIANIAAHSDAILFSSTPDDDNEPTHATLRRPETWMKAFGRMGFIPDPSLETIAISPQAVLLTRRDVTVDEIVGGYEELRYRLAADLQHERLAAAAAREGARTAREEAAVVTADASKAAKTAQSRLDEAERRAAQSEAALVEAMAAGAEAAESAERTETELELVKNSTWWRLGRPIRRGITEVRVLVRPRSESGIPLQSVSASFVRFVKPMIPIHLRRLIVRDYPEFARRVKTIQTPGAACSVDDLIGNAFPLLQPLRVFPPPAKQGRRLTLVTDSFNEGSLFGGVGTSIVLVSLLAQRLEASLRIVTRKAPPNPANFGIVLRAQEIEFDRNVEFVFVPVAGHESLPLHDRDLILTTSWWSTWSTVRAVAPEKIVYLIQEDERLFYPAGDEQAACSETMSDGRIRFVINTAMLRDHLVREGFSNIDRRGIPFEPAFPESLYFPEARPADDPRRAFFFYARPNNVRNLFLHGLAAIDEAIASDILDPAEWRFHFVGSGIPSLQLNRGVIPMVSENLPWPEYAALIRRVDVGLSLMSTPHPSYPPLDLAACGAVAITNRFGTKQDLDRYSSNIICTDLSHDAIVEGIAAAVVLAQDGETRQRNYDSQQLSRNWGSSLGAVLDELSDWA